MKPHTHADCDMAATAWTLDGLLHHLLEYHGQLIGPVGKTTGQLARIHAGEHAREAS